MTKCPFCRGPVRELKRKDGTGTRWECLANDRHWGKTYHNGVVPKVHHRMPNRFKDCDLLSVKSAVHDEAGDLVLEYEEADA